MSSKTKRKRNQILSDNEETDDDSVVALTPIQPPSIRIAGGPFWSLWILWDRASRERFTSSSNNEDAEKYFNKVKECRIGYNTPSVAAYKMVRIVKIDKKDMPHLLRLKVNLLPMQKKDGQENNVWDILVYHDLGVTLSKIVHVKSILIVDGPTLDSKRLIALNNKTYNRFSRVFLNYEGPVTDQKDFLEQKRISTAGRFECSVFSNSGGSERKVINSVLRLMPYEKKDIKTPTWSYRKLKNSPVVSVKRKVDNKSRRIDVEANNELLAGGFIRSDNELEEQERSISNIFEESDPVEKSQSQKSVDVRIDDEENNEEINITIANPSPHTTPKPRYRSPRTKNYIAPTMKNNNYHYEKLMELKKQLDQVEKPNRGRGSIVKLPDQRYVYGIVQTVENNPNDSPSTYRIRIKDETMDGVLVRLHSTESEGTGIQPSIDDIIRIHRVTVQFEVGDHLNMVLSTCHHRNYVLFDSSLNNVNGPIIRTTIAKNITFEKSDEDRIRLLRRVLKSDYEIATNSIPNSSFEKKDDLAGKSPPKTRASSRKKSSPLVITIDEDEISQNDSMHSVQSILSESEEEEDVIVSKQKRAKTPSPTVNLAGARITRSKAASPQKDKESRRRKADTEDGNTNSKRRK